MNKSEIIAIVSISLFVVYLSICFIFSVRKRVNYFYEDEEIVPRLLTLLEGCEMKSQSIYCSRSLSIVYLVTPTGETLFEIYSKGHKILVVSRSGPESVYKSEWIYTPSFLLKYKIMRKIIHRYRKVI